MSHLVDILERMVRSANGDITVCVCVRERERANHTEQ